MKTNTTVKSALGVTLIVLGWGAVASAQTYTALKSFGVPTSSTGRNPQAPLVQGPDGTLYGTAANGAGSVKGTVFKLNRDGTGFTVLKWFTNSTEGATPLADLTLSGSTLYGTTWGGGDSSAGTVFQVNTDGTGYTVLKHFPYADYSWGYTNSDGANPRAGLALAGTTLYGTTYYGGSEGWGTVFKMEVDGAGYTVLKNFAGSDGRNPQAGLTLSGSTLYGTTVYGGASGYGTVFQLNTNGTGYTVLKEFAGYPIDGSGPYVGLTVSGNTLYGTTYAGGSSSLGTVFKVNTDGTGYTVLKHFTGSDGRNPQAGLTLWSSRLYGTTYSGGSSIYGTVFKVATNGTGYTVLKHFTSSDGRNPQAGLTLWGGTLYGTTYSGGTSNYGTVFSLSLAPVITHKVLESPNLVWGGTSGYAGDNYYVLASTNLDEWRTNWTRVATNTFRADGTFSETNAAAPARRNLFYCIQVP